MTLVDEDTDWVSLASGASSCGAMVVVVIVEVVVGLNLNSPFYEPTYAGKPSFVDFCVLLLRATGCLHLNFIRPENWLFCFLAPIGVLPGGEGGGHIRMWDSYIKIARKWLM